MRTPIAKTCIFAAAATLASGYALAANQYKNDTEAAQIPDADWYNPAVWSRPADADQVPNWTNYPDDGTSSAYLDFFYDLSLGYDFDGNAANVTVDLIFTKVQGSTLSINNGATLKVMNALNNDNAAIINVNEGSSLYIKNTSRGIINVNGGSFETSAFSGVVDALRGSIAMSGGSVTNTGSTSVTDINIKGGTLANTGSFNDVNLVQSGGSVSQGGGTSNSTFKISGGELTHGGSFANTSIELSGGSLKLNTGVSALLQQNSTLTLLGSGSFKGTTKYADGAGENIAISASTVNFGGGTLSDLKQISMQSSSNLNFGYTDADGVFHAAAAHSLQADWKILIQDSNWKFSAANSNLITSNADADLKANAFAYAGTEFQFWWDRGPTDDPAFPKEDTTVKNFTLDFSNIDFSGLETGTYYLSLIACELNFHSYAEPTFDFVDQLGETQLIAMATEYEYSENLTFEVLKNSNSTAYYLEISITSAVPEPATYAAIFGALALAFAACRRRK